MLLNIKLPAAKIRRMGQTLSGDLDGGALMCEGGSLGPVGSPGWRRRDACWEEELKAREAMGVLRSRMA